MELTVANDFQNNLDWATVNSFVSHLADTLSRTEYLPAKARNENNTAYSKKFHQNAQRFLKSLELFLD